jgi:hypothetical protein
MNAVMMADLLLELNVLNPQDLKREVMRMAAQVSEPRARQWFKRVVTYWLINIDKLAATPYKYRAEPRPFHPIAGGSIQGGKYHFHPSGKWVGPKRPDEPEVPGGATPAQTEFCTHVSGSGVTCPRCAEKGQQQLDLLKQRTVQAESLVAFLLEQEEEDPEGVYTSGHHHKPEIEKHISQNFTKFEKPSAAAKWLPGDPPTKKQTPKWATPEKELHHFDPIQVRRRELFGRLEQVVNYLNWQQYAMTLLRDAKTLEQAKAQAKADGGDEAVQEVEMEQQQAIAAKELFRSLETMKTEDIDGFRRVLEASLQFTRDIKDKPWLFIKDAQVVAREGVYKVIRSTSEDSTLRLANRKINPAYAKRFPRAAEAAQAYGHLKPALVPYWCVQSKTYANNYLKDGPLYFIDKDGYPYALFHHESGQLKNPDDVTVDAKMRQELAPMVAAVGYDVANNYT